MSRVLQIAAIVAALVSFAQPAAAQEGFRLGYTDVGATIGLGGIGGATAQGGARAGAGPSDPTKAPSMHDSAEALSVQLHGRSVHATP